MKARTFSTVPTVRHGWFEERYLSLTGPRLWGITILISSMSAPPTKINDPVIPEIWVLNLARRPERRADAKRRMIELGLKHRFVEALDGLLPEATDSLDATASEHNRANSRERRGNLTPGELGCYETHRLAWRSLVAGSAGAAWIVEDDVLPTTATVDGVGRAVEQLRNSDWTLIYVVKRSRSDEFKRVCSGAFPPPIVRGWDDSSDRMLTSGLWRVGPQLGLYSYVLSPTGASLLLEQTGQRWAPIDVEVAEALGFSAYAYIDESIELVDYGYSDTYPDASPSIKDPDLFTTPG